MLNNYRQQRLAEEKKSQQRRLCLNQHKLTILVRPRMEKFQVLLREISVNEVLIHVHSPLEAGSVLAMQRIVPYPGTSWIRSGKVQEVLSQEDGSALVSCSMSPPFSKEELDALE